MNDPWGMLTHASRSCNGQYMKDIGLEKAAGVVSDNTGNTKKARRLLRDAVGSIVDLQDVCHLLHNTIKQICQLPYFKDVSRSSLNSDDICPDGRGLFLDHRKSSGIGCSL